MNHKDQTLLSCSVEVIPGTSVFARYVYLGGKKSTQAGKRRWTEKTNTLQEARLGGPSDISSQNVFINKKE